ncbi:MAG: alpha/beta hydrolase, partial [Gammaproteobacteria bacterium]
MNTIGDYVLHYLDLFDLMRLTRFNLLGLSMGGWMASEFAVSHSHRLHKLALVAPAGLPAPEYPGPTGVAAWSLDEMYGYLVSDVSSIKAHLPTTPEETAVHVALIRREMQAAGRLFSGGAFNPKLERWLHRVTVPTLLVWSKADRLTPVGRSEKWMKGLPDAALKLVDGAGHLTLDESGEAREAVLRFFS